MNRPTHSRPADKVIETFVMYLASTLYPSLRVIDWPDRTNARTSDIDTIAESEGKRIAIEHTSADFLPDQRRHDDRFMEALGCLEQELKGQLNCRLRIVTQFGTVPTGVSWNGIRDRLRNWILHDVPHLPKSESMHIITIDGVPFPLSVQRSLSGTHGVFFARSVTEETNFAERLHLQIDRKAQKLAKYRETCDLLILLIENDDIANISRATMIKAVETSYPHSLPNGLDKVWHADSSIPHSIQFWNITPGSRKYMPIMNAQEELENPPE